MIRQFQEGGEPKKQPHRDTEKGWRQAVEGWEIPTQNFPDDDDLDPADFFEPEDLPI
jgi:hypothetical protein